MRPLVTADVYPAIISIAPPNTVDDETTFRATYRDTHPQGTRTIDRARIVILEDKVLIAVDSPTGPTLVFRESILSYAKNKELREHYITTTSGKAIAVAKDHNCGCGSRLRSWTPLGNIMLNSDPTEF